MTGLRARVLEHLQDRCRTGHQVAAELGQPVILVHDVLVRLCDDGLLTRHRPGAAERWRFCAPQSDAGRLADIDDLELEG